MRLFALGPVLALMRWRNSGGMMQFINDSWHFWKKNTYKHKRYVETSHITLKIMLNFSHGRGDGPLGDKPYDLHSLNDISLFMNYFHIFTYILNILTHIYIYSKYTYTYLHIHIYRFTLQNTS